jgi:arylsulfatase A-like enzyme
MYERCCAHKFNIILISIDALRPDCLGCYKENNGKTRDISPNIDDFAENSILYLNTYCTTPATDPSHTSIFTGLYPRSHGIINHGPWIQQKEIDKFYRISGQFLSNILRSHDYTTLAIDWLGRWHKTGYDYYSGLLSNKFSQIYNGFYQKIYTKLPYQLINAFPGSISPYEKASYIVSNAKDLIERIKEKRFFLFIHLWDTHSPYDPPSKYIDRFSAFSTQYNKRISKVINRIKDPNFKKYVEKCTHGAETTDEILHRYLGAVNFIDEQIGTLISYLKSIDLFNHTIIILMSDHGESLGEHDTYFVHHTHFEEILKTALIIRIPDIYERFSGKKVYDMVQHVDVLPTILEAVKIKSNYTFDGKSILPKGHRRKPITERCILFNLMDKRTGSGRRIGLINGDWKYSQSLDPEKICKRCGIRHHQSRELFNIKNDPLERNNLISEKDELARKLRMKLLRV